MIAERILVLSRTVGLARDVQVAAGAGCVVTHHDRAGDVEDVVTLKGPFDVIVAGPLLDSRRGLGRLRRLREVDPGPAIVLALPSPPRAPIADIVRVGAVALVELPVERRLLAAALRRAMASRPAPAPPSVDDGPDREVPLAEVLAVASPSGGSGKTFYATNLAYHLHRTTGRRVCLVDLDLQFGEVSAALRLKSRYTVVDAVARSAQEQEDLDASIEEYLVTHASGVWVLPAPRHPAEADRIGPADVATIIHALRTRFDHVVLDTPAQLSEVVLSALDQSTALICMATLDLPSIRNTRVFLDTLERLTIPSERIAVVLNKVEPDVGIRIEDANEVLGGRIVSVLPYAREVSRSLNQGEPVLAAAPRSPIAARLTEGMCTRVAPAAVTEAAPGGSTSRRRRRGPSRSAAEGPARRRWWGGVGAAREEAR